MIDSLTSRNLQKAANVVFWLFLLYTVHLVIICFQPIKESSQLLAVKWCQNNMSDVGYNNEAHPRGLYIFADIKNDNIILSQVDFRRKSLSQPYRYSYEKIMDLKDYRERGRPVITIECLKNNHEIIHGINYYAS
ncbi:hypothetical protein DBY68_011145 [Pseudocitrobacter sp. RIT415]|uniref:hypothetical protein n=1 Tax=Pseudocitrobacter sp. RIT415 TaxID=2202163 RepID=UPI000D3CE645|nr:hypothetical protein [Pseudocitrobacter sp. RIT 415]RAU49119.1 hypothetical protein DBY68_011145 [Pseudocitrobacter sp. RIT 415]